MGRNIRNKADSKIYHIVMKGNNGQQIFFDGEDYERFLSVLSECKKTDKFSLYAYCLMGNHIHLLLKEGKAELGLVMKRITTKYVYWYNRKYSREGHLFQGRYKSECVENEEYFFTAVRYIHQNPIKAGLCEKAEDYAYSSFNEYFYDIKKEHKQGAELICAQYSEPVPLCSVNAVFKIIEKECFYEYNIAENKDTCLEADAVRLNDVKATEIIKSITGQDNPSDLQKLSPERQRECITQLRAAGLSIRQICRLTGVSFGVVRSSVG